MEEDPPFPSPKYEKAVKSLLKNVKKAPTLAKIRNLFIDFSKKYTVIDSVWREWCRSELSENYKDYDETIVLKQLEKIKKLVQFHFYIWTYLDFNYETFTEGKFGRSFFWHFLNNFSTTRFFDQFKAEATLQALIYPHDRLKDIYHFAKKRLNYPIPAEIEKNYKNARKEFDKIGISLLFYSNFAYDKKLFIAGLKNYANFGDKLLVIENFECAIGLCPCNKHIWNMYFDYLKNYKKEEKRLLNLYSRYSRLFIDDFEKLVLYQEELERQSLRGKNVSKWWIDVIQIAKDFVGIGLARNVLEKALNYSKQENLVKYGLWFETEYGTMEEYMSRYLWSIKVYPELENLHNFTNHIVPVKSKIEFNHKTDYKLIDIKPKQYIGDTFKSRKLEPLKTQTFPFRSSFMSYILKFSNPTVMLKLFMSAKYFFLLQKFIFCHNLTIVEKTENDKIIFYPYSLFTTPDYIDYSIPNFTVTNGLFILCKNQPFIFSNLIHNINFKIKHLILTDQILDFSDFEFLVKLKLKSLKFDNTVVKNEDSELPTEKMIFMLDGIKDLSLLQINYSSESLMHLCKIKLNVKFKMLEMSLLNETFNFQSFMEFSKNNIKTDGRVALYFDETITKEQRKMFDEIMQKDLPDVKFYNK